MKYIWRLMADHAGQVPSEQADAKIEELNALGEDKWKKVCDVEILVELDADENDEATILPNHCWIVKIL